MLHLLPFQDSMYGSLPCASQGPSTTRTLALFHEIQTRNKIGIKVPKGAFQTTAMLEYSGRVHTALLLRVVKRKTDACLSSSCRATIARDLTNGSTSPALQVGTAQRHARNDTSRPVSYELLLPLSRWPGGASDARNHLPHVCPIKV